MFYCRKILVFFALSDEYIYIYIYLDIIYIYNILMYDDGSFETSQILKQTRANN